MNRVFIPGSVYLACRFGRQEEMRQLRVRLHNDGILVTSTWLDAVRDDSANTPEQKQQIAATNFRDIVCAEFFLTHTENAYKHDSFSTIADELKHWKSAARGGRHVELGYALAVGATVMLVGPRENFAHSDHRVHRVDSTDLAIEYLSNPAARSMAGIG